MNLAVVLVGYNRPDGMKRLIQSVCEADYSCADNVDLIMSLDRSEKQKEQIEILQNTTWEHGQKVLRAFEERQGLKKHVLQCGDLTQKYDAVVVLEDDLLVAKGYISYVVQAIQFYGNDPRIAGISLYTHRTNPGNGRHFEAVHNGFDAYLKQYAQSWGQCWTRKMWENFRTWYENNTVLTADRRVPPYVLQWNEQSWLKYYITYTATTEKYFVYPYVALSTNASDVGEHCREENNDYQVPLSQGSMEYRFPSVDQAVKYDAFFEREFSDEELLPELPGKKLLDLYGLREDYGSADILVSCRPVNYRVIDTFGLKYRPQEANCLIREKGNDIFVYDLHTVQANKKNNRLAVARYDIKALPWHGTLLHGLSGLKRAIQIRLPWGKRRKR